MDKSNKKYNLTDNLIAVIIDQEECETAGLLLIKNGIVTKASGNTVIMLLVGKEYNSALNKLKKLYLYESYPISLSKLKQIGFVQVNNKTGTRHRWKTRIKQE